MFRHHVSGFAVARYNNVHSIAFLVFITWVAQMVSGFFLLGMIAYQLDSQFFDLIKSCFHGNFIWMLSNFHMLNANFAVMLLMIHFVKSFSNTKVLSSAKIYMWMSGSLIFLLSLATAFTGYVLVSGNMSFWAALVILNLCTVMPMGGSEMVSTVLGGTTFVSWSVSSFTVMHFAMSMMALLALLMHIMFLHSQSPSTISSDLMDGTSTLWQVMAKDLAITMLFFSMLMSEICSDLMHPDNWSAFSSMQTPAHMEPEIYFLWSFSMIKLHNSKALGLVFQDPNTNLVFIIGSVFSTAFALQIADQISAILLATCISMYYCMSIMWFMCLL